MLGYQRSLSPFPEEFLSGFKDVEFCDPEFLEADDMTDYRHHSKIVVCPKVFKYLDNIIDKPSRFNFDKKKRYTLRESNSFLDFVVPLLQKTKSVISGSWILNDYLNLEKGRRPVDIDIFSESLDLLILICKSFRSQISQTSLSYNSSFMSYELFNTQKSSGYREYEYLMLKSITFTSIAMDS